jgi:hypothetical protein
VLLRDLLALFLQPQNATHIRCTYR